MSAPHQCVSITAFRRKTGKSIKKKLPPIDLEIVFGSQTSTWKNAMQSREDIDTSCFRSNNIRTVRLQSPVELCNELLKRAKNRRGIVTVKNWQIQLNAFPRLAFSIPAPLHVWQLHHKERSIVSTPVQHRTSIFTPLMNDYVERSIKLIRIVIIFCANVPNGNATNW